MTDLSVVSALYRNRDSVAGLIARVTETARRAGIEAEMVLVDDCCPEGSGELALVTASPLPVRVLFLDRNVGQQAASAAGIRHATGDLVALLDADLQDRPEDLPALLDTLSASDADVVAAGRRGLYSSPFRVLTGRLFRAVRFLASRGRIPPDAGMFLVGEARLLRRAADLGDPRAHLLSCLARLEARIASVPLARDPRPDGRSAYGALDRLRLAAGALATLTPLHRLRARHASATWTPPRIVERHARSAEPKDRVLAALSP